MVALQGRKRRTYNQPMLRIYARLLAVVLALIGLAALASILGVGSGAGILYLSSAAIVAYVSFSQRDPTLSALW
jgi:hypothetical protein